MEKLGLKTPKAAQGRALRGGRFQKNPF